MRRAAVLAALSIGLLLAADAGQAQTASTVEMRTPRHPLSEGTPLREIVPPKPDAEKPAPLDGNPAPPKEPVEQRSRQPTQPPRLQPGDPPKPPEPIEMRNPLQRPEKPRPPIGTIDPRPGTIRTFPGTIEAR